MGVLATLAATLFPDYVVGTNTPASPSMATMRQIFVAVDNAIPNAQDLSAETAARKDAEVQLSSRIDGVSANVTSTNATLSSRIDGVSANVTSTNATLSSRIDGVSADLTSTNATLSAAINGNAKTISDALNANTRSLQSGIDAANGSASAAVRTADNAVVIADTATAAVVDLLATVPLNERPGDNPNAFTIDLFTGISGIPPNAAQVVGANGRELRISGPFVLGSVGLRAVEPYRTYKVRSVFRRIVDSPDPSGDAVGLYVAWYGADRNLLALSPLAVAVVDGLSVAMGRQEWSGLISANPSNPAVLQIPPAACYFRPFVRAYGDAAATTAVQVISHADVTDAGIVSPSFDAVLAQIAGLADRVDALASGSTTIPATATTTPEGALFWIEFKAAAMPPSATGTSGQSRASGATAGTPSPYSSFVATVHSTVDGVLTVVNEDAPDIFESMKVPAGKTATLRVDVLGSSFHSNFNPTAAATVSLSNGFTNN